MSENLAFLYKEEETTYTTGDYQRAAKVRVEIQRWVRQINPKW